MLPFEEPPPLEETSQAPAPNLEFSRARSALYSLEDEEAVLGSVLLDADVLDDLARLTSEKFYLVKHRWVWDCFLKLREAGTPIDYLTVCAELDKKGRLSEIGGAAYLTHLLAVVPTYLNAEAYGKRVHELWMRRKVLESAAALAKLAFAENADLEDAVNQHVSGLERTVFSGTGNMSPVSDVMRRLYDHAAEVVNDPNKFGAMNTGFPDLNLLLGGGLFQREMTLLTGDPGVGKSKLVMQLAENLARAGNAGAVFELEMPELQIAARMVSARTKVPTREIQYGPIRDDTLPVMIQALDAISQLPIWISTDDSWNTLTLRATLSRLKREQRIKWAVVDFFDLLTDEFQDSLLRDTVMARRLSSMARTLDLALIVVVTLNKTGMAEKEKRLAHLSGSGKISYAANNVIHLTEHIPEKGMSPDPNLVTVSVSKMRDAGIAGSIDLLKLDGYPSFGSVVSRALDLSNL